MSDVTEQATVRPFGYMNEYERDPVVIALRQAMQIEKARQTKQEEEWNVVGRELQQANAVAANAQNKYDTTRKQVETHKYNLRILKKQERARIQQLKDQDGMDA